MPAHYLGISPSARENGVSKFTEGWVRIWRAGFDSQLFFQALCSEDVMFSRWFVVKIPVKSTFAVCALLFSLSGMVYLLRTPIPDAQASVAVAAQVEDADSVRSAITAMFATAPSTFNLPAASSRLARSRLEGYAVCTPSTEATAAQYIEVAELLDKVSKHAGDFQRVVDGVMGSTTGMSDCDFRVINAIAKAAISG